MDYETADPDAIAEAIAQRDRPARHLAAGRERDGAARAAALIAELV